MMHNRKKKYEWVSKRNEWLKAERNISFEAILFHLVRGDVWKIANHPDQESYHEQRRYFVAVEEYVYIVPHIVEGDYIFLKTIIPSRKATKAYKKELEG